MWTFYQTIPSINNPARESFWKHSGKRRKYWWPAFSLFPIMFSMLLVGKELISKSSLSKDKTKNGCWTLAKFLISLEWSFNTGLTTQICIFFCMYWNNCFNLQNYVSYENQQYNWVNQRKNKNKNLCYFALQSVTYHSFLFYKTRS